MKSTEPIFKNIIKSNNIIYFLIGGGAFLFKYVSKQELSALIFFILIVINLLKLFTKSSLSLQLLLKQLNWIFIPLFIYSFFFKPKIIGLLMIAHFFSDTIARIIRSNIKPFYKKYFPKNINGTLFFVLSYYILSLLYIYLFDGFILKRYIFIFFINSLVLGFLENSFKIRDYPDNFNLNIFGILLIFLSLNIDFRLGISLGFNQFFGFGFFWCLIPIVPLVLFDIISLKKAYIYYLFFILLYTGLRFNLFLFNVFILASMGLIKKINQFYTPSFRYNRSFIEISEIKEYFLLSVIFVFIYFLIPPVRKLTIILRAGLVVGLITALLHCFYFSLDSYISKKYFKFKNFKISLKIFLFNIGISLLFLSAGYLMNIIKNFNTMIYAFAIINIFMLIYIFLSPAYFKLEDNKLIKYLIPYFSFKIFFLYQLL